MRVIANGSNVYIADLKITISVTEPVDLTKSFSEFQIKHSKKLHYALEKKLIRIAGSKNNSSPPPPKDGAWI